MSAVERLSTKETLRALAHVAKTTYRASPGAVFIKLAGAMVTALVPLAAAYFAARTTTLLAAAFAGDQAAGVRALWYVVITGALGVLTGIWNSVRDYINQLTSYKIDAATSDALYDQLVSLEYWRYDSKETADMFDKAQNFSLYFSRFFDSIANMVSALVQGVVGVVALFLTSWWIGALIMAAIVPSVLIQFKLAKMRAKHWRDNTEVRRKENGITWSLMQPKNLAELRVYNAAKYMLGERAKYRDMDRLERIKYERDYMGRQLAADAFESVAEITSLVSVAVQIMNHSQPLGQFIFVQQMISRSLSSMHSLAGEISNSSTDIATMADYEAFMRLPRTDVRRGKIPRNLKEIEFRDVSFAYPGSKTMVLRHVNLRIPLGQHIAIVGENGAGKSTLIKLLMGLYTPTEGAVLLDGVSLASLDEDEWHSLLGVLQQDFIRYHFATVRENVVYGDTTSRPDDKRLKQALKQAEADGFVEKLPKGVDTLPNQWFEHEDGTNGVDLSGGQWQRVALARNFYRQAPIVVLDEPTSAIDALAESRIFARLFDRHERTVVVISHRFTTIKKADVVYMLKGGEIVEQGTSDELVARRGEFYTMFESQIK